MTPEAYPPQEPFTELGERYHREVMARTVPPALEVVHGEDPYQSLAVHPAASPGGEVLCMLHGGGWTNGYKEWMAFMAPALNAEGVTLVTLGYRLAPRHLYPAGYHDVLDGIAWVWAHIERHGGDRERIFLGGHSAGGHYAALAGLREDWQGQRGLPSEVVRGVLPISGIYTFGPDSGLPMRPRFLGTAPDEEVSPVRWVRADAPAFMLTVGEQDFPHLKAQARMYAETLREIGGRVDCVELAGCDHLLVSYASGERGGVWPRRAIEFMRSR